LPGGEGEDDNGGDVEHGEEPRHEVHSRLEEGHHPVPVHPFICRKKTSPLAPASCDPASPNPTSEGSKWPVK
jgi:hypothetical protein